MIRNRIIYFDNASTTSTDKQVIAKMEPFFDRLYANPSNVYSLGLIAKEAVEKSRKTIARFVNAEEQEIIFTSGGTEANNLAIFGSVLKRKKGKIITSAIEHPSVLRPLEKLANEGYEVIKIKPQKDGIINADDIKKYLNEDVILVSVMYANNEIGTIQPIAEIAKIIKVFNSKNKIPINQKIIFHTDACQATQYLEMDVQKLGVDLMTINSSKIHGPKGVGALYKRSSVKLDAQILGGGQERGMRSGTENVPGIVGFGAAIELIKKSDAIKTEKIRDYIINQLKVIDKCELNGSLQKRLANNINISFSNVEGESLVLYLSKKNIFVSTGSACSSKSLQPSHVITAIKNKEIAHSSLRITLSRYNTIAEAKTAVFEIKKSVEKLRKVSK